MQSAVRHTVLWIIFYHRSGRRAIGSPGSARAVVLFLACCAPGAHSAPVIVFPVTSFFGNKGHLPTVFGQATEDGRDRSLLGRVQAADRVDRGRSGVAEATRTGGSLRCGRPPVDLFYHGFSTCQLVSRRFLGAWQSCRPYHVDRQCNTATGSAARPPAPENHQTWQVEENLPGLVTRQTLPLLARRDAVRGICLA